MKKLATIAAIALLATTYIQADEEMKLHKEVVINVPLEQAWLAWVSSEGAQTFFAPKTIIDPRPGGPYEIHFFPDAPAGQRGAEGLKVLAVDPKRSISFEWNAPPMWPNIRAKKLTRVTIHFEGIDTSKTRVSLIHDNWGVGTFEGESWREVYDYFDSAWDLVLRRFVFSIEEGPLSWDEEGADLSFERYQERITQHHK